MLRIRSLGKVPYHEAYALQHALATGAGDDYLLLLEHPHTYTLGAHADERHVLVDPALVGATLERTDRGGDVTYHGPGQLVAYPIVGVPDHPASGPQHVHRLEQIVIDTLADLGLPGGTSEDEYPGVWIDGDGSSPRKIAAIGVRTLRVGPGRRRTLHGVALNVTPDLDMFGHIVPCGIADRGVTSLRAEGIDVAMDEVVEAFVARAAALFADGGVERHDVVTGPAGVSASPTSGERPLLRRLRQAGVVPEEGLDIAARKPPSVRVPVRIGKGYRQLGATIHDLGLVTVCEEAGCPNIYECWADGTATFMINGERCTRACGFCQVDTRHPLPLSPDEPERVASAVERMALGHAVVTCVARDDLADGGAGAMAQTIGAIRDRNPETTVEVLISDCRGDASLPRDHLRGPARRAEPQHRDGGPAPAGGAALGGLRAEPGGARPGSSGRAGHQVGAHGGFGGARGRGHGDHGRPARRRRLHHHHRAVPASEPGASPRVPLLGCRGVRPAAAGRVRARCGPRGGVAAHPLELSRPRGGDGRSTDGRDQVDGLTTPHE